ncbi:MAG: DUF5320 domain-containing protein [Oscillospiraceae bacterium]|nr:DUF5320 domain-containing protein [Oscillospiraceae bacterium]
MPRRDGTGPMGAGSMTARGLPLRAGAKTVKRGTGLGPGFGLGFACRHGFGRRSGRGVVANHASSKTHKELLQEQRDALKNRLEVMEKHLENL